MVEELQAPFAPPADPSLWHEQLAKVEPPDLFMRMVDNSKNSDGSPGLDPTDGILYIVPELCQCSLRGYLTQRRDEQQSLPKDHAQNLTKAIILVMAGLRAKGFVHAQKD